MMVSPVSGLSFDPDRRVLFLDAMQSGGELLLVVVRHRGDGEFRHGPRVDNRVDDGGQPRGANGVSDPHVVQLGNGPNSAGG